MANITVKRTASTDPTADVTADVTTDPRVDAYIANSAPFAQPILTRLRKLVHTTCPQATETIKWGFPAFMYHGILCSMSAFKAHCAFGFWHPLMRHVGASGKNEATKDSMGNYGRITSLKDLPASSVIRAQIKQAMAHHTSGVKVKPVARQPRKPLSVPADLAKALAKNAKARKTFDSLSPSHRRDYIEWITEAKRPETRLKRLATTLQWLTLGRRRNWEYENC